MRVDVKLIGLACFLPPIYMVPPEVHQMEFSAQEEAPYEEAAYYGEETAEQPKIPKQPSFPPPTKLLAPPPPPAPPMKAMPTLHVVPRPWRPWHPPLPTGDPLVERVKALATLVSSYDVVRASRFIVFRTKLCMRVVVVACVNVIWFYINSYASLDCL